jgi:hypothetical protein
MKKTIMIILAIMGEILKVGLSIINLISLVLVVILGLTVGAIGDLFGTAVCDKILQYFNIPWNTVQIVKFGFVCLIVFIISYFLGKIFSNK